MINKEKLYEIIEKEKAKIEDAKNVIKEKEKEILYSNAKIDVANEMIIENETNINEEVLI
jgi:hypothetical protein